MQHQRYVEHGRRDCRRRDLSKLAFNTEAADEYAEKEHEEQPQEVSQEDIYTAKSIAKSALERSLNSIDASTAEEIAVPENAEPDVKPMQDPVAKTEAADEDEPSKEIVASVDSTPPQEVSQEDIYTAKSIAKSALERSLNSIDASTAEEIAVPENAEPDVKPMQDPVAKTEAADEDEPSKEIVASVDSTPPQEVSQEDIYTAKSIAKSALERSLNSIDASTAEEIAVPENAEPDVKPMQDPVAKTEAADEDEPSKEIVASVDSTPPQEISQETIKTARRISTSALNRALETINTPKAISDMDIIHVSRRISTTVTSKVVEKLGSDFNSVGAVRPHRD